GACVLILTPSRVLSSAMSALLLFLFLFFMLPPPPTSTLFPYTTLFRSIERTGALCTDEEIPAICPRGPCALHRHRAHRAAGSTRSEEHTSELQSHLNLVCRLLLEKKNMWTDCLGFITAS